MTTICYQLTEREVVRGFIKYRKQPKRIFWARLALCICGVLMLSDYYVTALHPAALLFLGLFFLFVPVVLWIISPSIIYRAYAKVVRGNPMFTDPKEVAFDDEKITFVSPHRRSELAWVSFVRISQDGQYFYLHGDHLGNVTLLPKRALDTTSMEEFLRCSHFPTQP